jgi:hypothetical protein
LSWFESIRGSNQVTEPIRAGFQAPKNNLIVRGRAAGVPFFWMIPQPWQSYDEKPRQRLWQLMKSEGMQENQQVVFMSDAGEHVRRVQEYLHPFSDHLIDWFHIAMRLTVLQQQTKALQEERPETGADVSKQLESVKYLLWHGNTEEALERVANQLMELSLISAGRKG